jgi:hypothetical protein
MRIQAGLEKGHLIQAGMDSFRIARDKRNVIGMLKAIDLLAKLSGLYPKKLTFKSARGVQQLIYS